MVGLQLGSAALMILLAVWRLRPAFRRHEATQPRRKWFEGKKNRPARAPRWWDRPECGEDAMAWKERHFARTDVLTKMVVLPATILVSVFIVLVVGLDEPIVRAFADLWQRGLRGWGTSGDEMVKHLRVVSAWYVAIWLLALAGASASSVAVEREEDTWVSLTSTPLTGWEILRGKALGAIWAQRGFGMVPLGLWTFGLLTGSVHPLGFLGALVALEPGHVPMVAAVGIHPRVAQGDHALLEGNWLTTSTITAHAGRSSTGFRSSCSIRSWSMASGGITPRSSACRRGWRLPR